MKPAAQALDKRSLVDFYRQMRLLRIFEERAAEQYMRGRVRGFLHLYIGEEAIAAGAISTLEPQDYIATHYRDHGHALARGLDPKVVMAELFGKVTGCSKGMGGSMHLFDASRNFMGGYAIVGGQLPLAVGLGLAASYLKENRVVLCILGDGALNEGEFHESMNLAAIWRLPVVFLCENNLYGMGSPVKEVFAAADEIYRIVEPYHIPSSQVDGMDVLAVREAMEGVVGRVRDGGGPYFLEALTYRFRGHSMADPSEYRSKEEEAFWQKRDPVAKHRQFLLANGIASEAELETIGQGVEEQVEEAIRFAEESPDPAPEALYENLYANP